MATLKEIMQVNRIARTRQRIEAWWRATHEDPATITFVFAQPSEEAPVSISDQLRAQQRAGGPRRH